MSLDLAPMWILLLLTVVLGIVVGFLPVDGAFRRIAYGVFAIIALFCMLAALGVVHVTGARLGR
jgi:hypothetical protein